MSHLTDLTIAYRRLSELKPDPRNPRKHDQKQIRKIADSIATFGFYMPIVVDANDAIIIGHGRALGAQKADLELVPTICLQHLTDQQVKALRIADNRLTDISTWDERLLAEQLKELAELDLAFNVEVTGFSMTGTNGRAGRYSSDADCLIENVHPEDVERMLKQDCNLVPKDASGS